MCGEGALTGVDASRRFPSSRGVDRPQGPTVPRTALCWGCARRAGRRPTRDGPAPLDLEECGAVGPRGHRTKYLLADRVLAPARPKSDPTAAAPPANTRRW